MKEDTKNGQVAEQRILNYAASQALLGFLLASVVQPQVGILDSFVQTQGDEWQSVHDIMFYNIPAEFYC